MSKKGGFNMKKENYQKVAEIDGCVIFKDKDGYFLFEHYNGNNGYYAVEVRLGKTLKEVERAIHDMNDWNYRAWHGEFDYILQEKEKINLLIKGE